MIVEEETSTVKIMKYEPTITLGNILSAVTGIFAVGAFWAIQTIVNSTVADHTIQITALKESTAKQSVDNALIQKDITYIKDGISEIRHEQKEVKDKLDSKDLK